MIKVNELRIGNFISDDDGVLAKVNGFEPFDHSTRCDEEEGCQILVDCYHANGARRTGCVTDSPECNPIPLTTEWLERCGFAIETIPDSVDEDGDIIKGYTHWTNGKFCFHFSDGKVEGREHIQYVHLFQNWYYFNTDEELTIKN